MFRTCRFLVLTVLLFGFSVETKAQQVALVTDVSGPVQVTRATGGAAQAATWGMQLNVGDRVATGAGARTSLLYSANNSLVSLAANANLTIAAGAPAGASASRTVGAPRIAAVSDLTLHRAGEGEVAALGGLRAVEAPRSITTLTPRQTRILQGAPSFAWMSAAEFESYTVRVFDANGREVWSGATNGSRLEYPANAPKLAAGTRYLWKVEGEDLLETVASELTPFDVLGEDDQRVASEGLASIKASFESDADATSRDYVLGAFYADLGLYSDAVASFSRIAQRHPDAALVHEILGKLYYDLGLKDEAILALQRALEARD